MKFSLTCLLIVSVLLAGASASPVSGQAGAEKPFFYFGLWPDGFVRYDPVDDKVVARAKTNNGLFFDIDLSHDKKSFFLTTAQKTCVEVLDRETMKIVDEHFFVQKDYIIRVDSIREIPGFTHWYVRIDRVKNEKDHYTIEKPEWLYYNIAEKKIEERMKELPKAIRSGARISPCGKKWHLFGSDIKIVDPETLKEEGKIVLSEPLYAGMGPIRVRGADLFDGKNPDAYRMMYTMRDPVKTRHSTAGIIEINIKDRKIANMTEWGADPGMWRLHLTHDKKFGVTTGRGGGRSGGERKTQLVTFDLEKGQRVDEALESFRPRRSLAGIAPDGSKVYVGGAGNDFRVYSRELEYLKTVKFDGDLYGRVYTLDG